MQKLLIILNIACLIGISGICQAQSIPRKSVSSAGGTLTGGSNMITFNIGETVIPSLSGGGNIITQGFEQPGEQINTGIIPSILCGGGSFLVPFSAIDIGGGNTFTAQLSNASGSFASPVNIGTLAGNASGNINAVIPLNTPSGSGYRIRVISSFPAVIGSDNGQNIAFSGLPCGWSAEPNGAGCNAGSSVAYDFNTQRFTVTSTNCYYPNSFTSDALAFAQYDLCGNGSITAQVTSINPLGLGWAGVTMRESNAAGAKKAQLMTNLGAFSRREFRTTTGAAAYPQQFPSQNRYWLRITRTGNQFAMYISQNGTSWSFSGTQTIVMGNCIEVGLVVTNYNPNSTVTANFANVSVTGGNITKPTINTQEDILTAADFTIMPNPTTGIISLDLSSYGKRQVRLDMYNLQGKLLRSTNIETGRGKEEIDLTAFASGMYLIRVRAEGIPDVTKRVVLNSNN